MRRSVALIAVLGSVALSAMAEPPAEAFVWLDRIMSAAQKLNYSGTFTYQRGSHSETSRIVHFFDGHREREKLEVLDGSPREVVRIDDEIKCYLPAEKVLIVQRQARRAFPALPREAMDAMARYYRVRLGATDRVAGREAQVLVVDPRDSLRYGYRFWAERASGLLLKSRTLDEKGNVVEQFAFTQVQLGAPIDQNALRSRFSDRTAQWQVINTRAEEQIGEDAHWSFSALPPGFTRSAGMKLRFRDNNAETMHYVFSDGMAAISVFVDRASDRSPRPREGFYKAGPMQGYRKLVDDQVVTVVGEVPGRALKQVADGLRAR